MVLTAFNFHNLIGTVYGKGNLLFSADGNSILSPVGNRVAVFDLVNNKSRTLAFENRKPIACIALSPDANILLSIDEDGRALLVNYKKSTVLHHFNFKKPVRDAQFSPDGRYILVTHGSHAQVWRTPSHLAREFAPFVLHRTYTGHYDDVLSVRWSADSRFFLTTSKDMTAKLYTLDPVQGYRPKTFAGHKDAVLAAYFSKDAETIYTVARDGAVYTWQSKDQPDSDDESDQEQVEPAASTSSTTSLSHPLNRIAATRWGVAEKNFFMRSGERVSSVCYHYASSLLIVGFSSGIFGLYQMPSFQQIHQLSISQEHITSVTINPTGEWLAFGASKLGQLLVWEWQTESYILKQQGHYYDMNCLAFSPDDGGQHIVTGGDDGKVKLWNASSGFCFVTFSEHSAPVTAVEFAKQGSVIFSASLDGTVRAFDLVRYRNFRTFQPPQPVQFNSLAVDPSGEIVCAAGNGAASEGFEIFVWSTQTGKIVEVLTGHEGPVSALSFSPGGDRLASASWDATVRTWELYGRKSGASEAMSVGGADGLSVAWKPDGSHVAVSNLKGQILIFDVQDARQVGLIDGRRDISGGRKLDDRRTAANSESSKAFTSISYTADGSCILAGGNSRHVCLYDVQESTLLRKWEISQNLALEGTQDFLDSRRITKDGVALDLIDETGDASDLEDRLDRDKALPGARSGDLSKRKYRPEARTKSVRISPSGRSWAGASTEGLLVYSLDTMQQDTFDPFELDVEVTPDNVAGAVKDRQFLKALVMAFRLNEQPVIRTAYEAVPTQDIALLARQLPVVHAEAACRFVAGEMEKGSRHIQFNLEWVEALLSAHGRWLQQRSAEVAATMRSLQRGLTDCQNHISKVCEENRFTLQYLMDQAKQNGDDSRFGTPMTVDGEE